MARFLAWLNKYGDSGLALFLAIGVGILTLADIVGPNDVNGAILLTLALVATASLRNRAREETMDNQLHDVLQGTERMLAKLPARLDELENTVNGTRRVLEESSYVRVPGKYYYEIYSRELMASLRQCRQVPMNRMDHIELSDEPSIDETRKLFTELELPLPRAFTDRNVAEIVSKAIQAKNPYR